MLDWLSTTKVASWMQILKSLPLDDGPDTTRAVVLSVNAAACIGLLMMYAAVAVMALRPDAPAKSGVIGILAGVIVPVTTAVLGFAMSMQKARDAKPSQTLVTQTASDGSSSTAAASEGVQPSV